VTAVRSPTALHHLKAFDRLPIIAKFLTEGRQSNMISLTKSGTVLGDEPSCGRRCELIVPLASATLSTYDKAGLTGPLALR
jgi:hypothetical protein